MALLTPLNREKPFRGPQGGHARGKVDGATRNQTVQAAIHARLRAGLCTHNTCRGVEPPAYSSAWSLRSRIWISFSAVPMGTSSTCSSPRMVTPADMNSFE